jgi:hypothetical protein
MCKPILDGSPRSLLLATEMPDMCSLFTSSGYPTPLDCTYNEINSVYARKQKIRKSPPGLQTLPSGISSAEDKQCGGANIIIRPCNLGRDPEHLIIIA